MSYNLSRAHCAPDVFDGAQEGSRGVSFIRLSIAKNRRLWDPHERRFHRRPGSTKQSQLSLTKGLLCNGLEGILAGFPRSIKARRLTARFASDARLALTN